MDRKLYKKHMQDTILNYPNLDVHAGSVFDLVYGHPDLASPAFGSPQWGTIEGVKLGKPVKCKTRTMPKISTTDSGEVIKCSQVVVCTGTFLSGEIHIGRVEYLFAEHYAYR